MSEPDAQTVVCTSCAAENPRSVERCTRCGAELRPASFDVTKSRRLLPDPPPEVGGASQFTLGSLMLFITLCAICMGLMSNSPGLGIFLALITLPAFIRTALLSRRREQLGRPLTRGDQLTGFVETAGMVVVAAVAIAVTALMTFFFACFCAYGGQSTSNVNPYVVWNLIVGVGVIFSLWIVSWFIRWVIHRWRDDTRP